MISIAYLSTRHYSQVGVLSHKGTTYYVTSNAPGQSRIKIIGKEVGNRFVQIDFRLEVTPTIGNTLGMTNGVQLNPLDT